MIKGTYYYMEWDNEEYYKIGGEWYMVMCMSLEIESCPNEVEAEFQRQLKNKKSNNEGGNY